MCKSSVAGVAPLSAYMFSSTDASSVRVSWIGQSFLSCGNSIAENEENLQNHLLEQLLPVYRACTEEELKMCPGDWKYGSFFTRTMTECRIWMPWATRK